MANDALAVRRWLIERGYTVKAPAGRGRTYYTVHDPRTGAVIARFPQSATPGRWRQNLEAGIKRYERTGVPFRSPRVSARGAATPRR